jgi:BASS family bile acid:Na+ symporter
VVLFTAVGLAVGHVLGGPHPDNAVVRALTTACRHPPIAVGIAAANLPGQFAATILIYLLASAVACMPYLAWRRRALRPAPAA